MKYIKLFEDITSFEDEPVKTGKMGDNLPNTDKHLVLINDLILELKDVGFRAKVNGYYAYHADHICYDIFIEKAGSYEIYDIKDVNGINIDLGDVQLLNTSMKDILSRLVDNELYLGSYSINMKDGEVSSHARLFRRIDGEQVNNFTYNSGDEDGDELFN
jgi:hypothetical protein